jgi:hypothetical protein
LIALSTSIGCQAREILFDVQEPERRAAAHCRTTSQIAATRRTQERGRGVSRKAVEKQRIATDTDTNAPFAGNVHPQGAPIDVNSGADTETRQDSWAQQRHDAARAILLFNAINLLKEMRKLRRAILVIILVIVTLLVLITIEWWRK